MANPYPAPRSVGGRSIAPLDRLEAQAGDGTGDDGEYEAPGLRRRTARALGEVLVRLGWLAVAALVALGSARLVAAGEHDPGSGARPELTWAADQRLSETLDASLGDVVRLSDEVAYLGDMARGAIAGLTQINEVKLHAAWTDGSASLTRVENVAGSLRARLNCRLGPDGPDVGGMERTYSPAVIDRYRRACAALGIVDPLREAWVHLVYASNRAMEVKNGLLEHDQAGEVALKLASQARYADALAQLRIASAAIACTRALRDEVAPLVDVSTLTRWLDRTAAMDSALAVLWQALLESNGKITPQVTAALKAANDARANLPDDNRAISVIVVEMGQVMTADGIDIETARGELADAVQALSGGNVVRGG